MPAVVAEVAAALILVREEPLGALERGQRLSGTGYLAHDPDIGRSVAIKTVRPETVGHDTAQELEAKEVVLGRSGKLASDRQAESFALRWGAVEPDRDREMTVRIVTDREDLRFAV